MTENKADSAEFSKANYKSSFEIPPLLLIETLSRNSFSYAKLPLKPISLTVLKLDGSSFDITVAKNPTVAQLKQGVEDAFNHFPKHGTGKVSWSHVWAQFCLCFNDQKLLSDQDNTAIHGIKDGDQLHFARHTSISYNLIKERCEKRDHDLQESKLSPRKQEVQKKEGDNDNPNPQIMKNKSSGVIAVNITCQCSWGLLWKRFFSYSTQKRQRTNYVELC